MPELFAQLKDMPHFDKDGRKHIYEIYKSFSELSDSGKWWMEIVYEYNHDNNGKKVILPIISFKTKNTGIAMYITAGIHGDEPSGPNALSENIEIFKEMENRGIPMIIYPVANPQGYVNDWRFPNLRRKRENIDKYKSESNPEGYYTIADAGHLVSIPQRRPEYITWYKEPISEDVGALTADIIKNFDQYKPLAHFDFHEDDDIPIPHLYAYAQYGQDFVTNDIVRIMKKYFHVAPYAETSFKDKIIEGIIHWKADGLLGDVFLEQVLCIDGIWKINNPAKFAITIETPSMDKPLEKRVALYNEIIQKLPEYHDSLIKNTDYL